MGNPLPFPSVGRTVKVAVAINVVEGSTMNFSPPLLAKFFSSWSGYLKRPNKFQSVHTNHQRLESKLANSMSFLHKDA